jgi:hypothetical protein
MWIKQNNYVYRSSALFNNGRQLRLSKLRDISPEERKYYMNKVQDHFKKQIQSHIQAMAKNDPAIFSKANEPDPPAPAQKKETAKAIQTKLDNQAAADKYNSWVDREIEIANRQLQELEAKRNVPTTLTQPTTPIPSWYLVGQQYYLGWDTQLGGVVISAKEGWKDIVSRICARSDNYSERNPITRSQFDDIIRSKPTWNVLQAAYHLVIMTQYEPYGFVFTTDGNVYQNRVRERMNLPKATVVF